QALCPRRLCERGRSFRGRSFRGNAVKPARPPEWDVSMNTLEDTRVTAPSQPEASQADVNLTPQSDRRADIESKQAWVSKLMVEVGCEGLLVLQPENFAWLTAGGISRGCVDAEAMPALYFTSEGRWLLASNVDSQRLFDEEIDGLGFQLKEWPWHWGR